MSVQPSVVALADDMTGALETGAKFSAAGIHAVVSAKPLPASSATALVFDTETRHVTPDRAGDEVARFMAGLHPRLIYKKTDSTLRGNISAELEALARLYPEWRIGYAPAYPALGRTVRAGILHVHGIAVAETEFARDALNPIRTSRVSAILHPELACTIFDGETDEHLEQAARAILQDKTMRIAAGPAGLAESLASELEVPRGAPLPLPGVRTCLLFNGSRHPRSAIQMTQAEARGWRSLQNHHEHGADPAEVAARNARFLAHEIETQKPDAVFVIGGDTAFALVRELGFPTLAPIAEIVPGVPVSRTDREFYLITKAGGFGEPDTLARVRAKLKHD